MVKELFRLRRVAAYLLYIGFGAFSTLFVLSIVAALANIPNYGAKLAGQDCACRVPNELILYIDAGGLMLGVGLLAPTLVFSGAIIYLIASRRLELSKEFKRFLSVGVLLAALIAATLLLTSSPLPEKGEAMFNSIKPYPLTVRLLNGSTFTTNALTGKVVVAQFFLPDCPICELQMQELKKIVNQKSVNAVFMLVVPSWSHISLDELEVFAQNVPDEVLVGFDIGIATKEYGVDVVPIIVVLSSDRSIAFMHIGLAKDDELMDTLSKLGALKTDVEEELLEEVREGVVYVYVEDHLEVPLIQRLAEGFRQKYPNISVIILWPNCCGSGKTSWAVDVITGSNM
ncbi:MAG: TlpA family protein disulfide reductase, partial [Nitrososphaerales archaeon]